MALPLKRLSVLPNPWCALDKDGRPCGVCAVDPDLFGVRYIGARHDSDQTKILGKAPEGYTDETWFRAYGISKPQLTVYRFATEPISVAATGVAGGVIRRNLRTRTLLPADKATATATATPWRELAEALAEEKAKAVALFDARNGEGAWDELFAQRNPVTGAETKKATEPEKASGPTKTDKKPAAPRAASKPDSD